MLFVVLGLLAQWLSPTNLAELRKICPVKQQIGLAYNINLTNVKVCVMTVWWSHIAAYTLDQSLLHRMVIAIINYSGSNWVH